MVNEAVFDRRWNREHRRWCLLANPHGSGPFESAEDKPAAIFSSPRRGEEGLVRLLCILPALLLRLLGTSLVRFLLPDATQQDATLLIIVPVAVVSPREVDSAGGCQGKAKGICAPGLIVQVYDALDEKLGTAVLRPTCRPEKLEKPHSTSSR